MIEKIATFYLFIFLALVALRLMKPNVITFIAFTWFGPFPEEGELLSSFKARRIRYAFSWVIQFSVYFALLILLGAYFKEHFFETFFIVAGFVGTIGMGMAVFAFFGFAISWLKTVTIGPNPKCEYIEEHEEQT
mgnify:CR=1 FL=1